MSQVVPARHVLAVIHIPAKTLGDRFPKDTSLIAEMTVQDEYQKEGDRVALNVLAPCLANEAFEMALFGFKTFQCSDLH